MQSSNPITESTITGYQPVDLSYKLDGQSSDKGFVGLGINTKGDNRANCAIDGISNHNNHFYCIGLLTAWKAGIPGPFTGSKDNLPVKVVTLYAKRKRG